MTLGAYCCCIVPPNELASIKHPSTASARAAVKDTHVVFADHRALLHISWTSRINCCRKLRALCPVFMMSFCLRICIMRGVDFLDNNLDCWSCRIESRSV